MNKENTEQIYCWLKFLHSELEDPCNECGEIDCEKAPVVAFMKKKHIVNMVDWKQCLKERLTEKERIEVLMRLPEFKSFSTKKCYSCNKLMHELDALTAAESKEIVNEKRKAKLFKLEFLPLCKPCFGKYKRRKTPLLKGYEKRL